MNQFDIEIRTLRKLDVHLEHALREAIEVKAPNTMDHRIRTLRAEIKERIENLTHERKHHSRTSYLRRTAPKEAPLE